MINAAQVESRGSIPSPASVVIPAHEGHMSLEFHYTGYPAYVNNFRKSISVTGESPCTAVPSVAVPTSRQALRVLNPETAAH